MRSFSIAIGALLKGGVEPFSFLPRLNAECFFEKRQMAFSPQSILRTGYTKEGAESADWKGQT